MAEHIHTWDDGRGRRRVFVNGKPMNQVVEAYTRKGVVRYHPHGIPVNKAKGRFIMKSRKGRVTVEFIDG